jgi:hypothetical protein
VSQQLDFELHGEFARAHSPEIAAALAELSTGENCDSRGAVYTRTEVVEFILDLVGYTADKPLFEHKLLEPSIGAGDFLLPVIQRLLKSWRAHGKPLPTVDSLGAAIRAVELHQATFRTTRAAVIELLKQERCSTDTAERLADLWLFQDDYLLTSFGSEFDFVVGNPPYVRQELIPDELLAVYRARFRTIYDRADLYIPFIEKSLFALKNGGSLGFICADRWMKNRYGRMLRKLVAEQFNLRVYVDMTDTPAFNTDVIAYPAITIIAREPKGPTRMSHRPSIDRPALAILAVKLREVTKSLTDYEVRELHGVTNGDEPWLLESSDQMELIRRLENDYPRLEEIGCKVGIGVATGADKAFIGRFDDLDVEDCRKLPLATTRDISIGEVRWQGLGVVNPFADSGGLVDLSQYPRLCAYLESRRDIIAGRHCARKAPANWYRTIDRIVPALANRPKLLIPDIKGEAHVVYEPGKLYPHHNLYYVISEEWDLRALQAVLLSSVTRLFISTYSTKMRGGFLRFQAQYLRRLRLPQWKDVSTQLREELVEAATRRNFGACNRATFKLYKLSDAECAAVGGIDD